MSHTARNFIIVVAGVLIIAAAFWYGKARENAPEPVTMGEYSAQQLGLRFEYRLEPDGYTLIEQDQTDSTGPIQTLVLVNTKEYEEALASTEPREGPPVITVAVFANPENLSAEVWANSNTQFSLYNLAMNEATTASLGGIEALTYRADGLYPSDTYIVSTNSKIYLISGSYLNPEDQIRRDFEDLLSSIEFF